MGGAISYVRTCEVGELVELRRPANWRFRLAINRPQSMWLAFRNR